MTPLRSLGSAALLATVLTAPAAVAAQIDCATARDWVQVELPGEAWAPADRDEVLDDLRAELDSRGIAICIDPPPQAPPPLATVRLAAPVVGAVVVSITIEDAVTRKRVSRDVPLDRVPPQGRPLTVALAATELLRASWIELAMRSRMRANAVADEPTPAPPAVRAIVAEETSDQGGPDDDLALLAAFEHSAGGLTQFGGALRFQHWIADPLAIAIAVGVRGALPLSNASGSVDATVFAATVGARVAFNPRTATVHVGLDVGATVLAVRFEGHGEEGVSIGLDRFDAAISLRGALFGQVHLTGDLHLEAAVGAGVPILGIVATDGVERLGGIEQIELTIAAGPSLTF